MTSASADGLIAPLRSTRTIRSPRIRTLAPDVTLRSRGSNRRALRMIRSPFGEWVISRATRPAQAALVFSCSVSSCFKAGSYWLDVTDSQEDADAAVLPLDSSQTD